MERELKMAEVNIANEASAITTATPDGILFGAGTVRYGFKVDEAGKPTAQGTIMGCTSGGSKLAITPNIVDIEIDQSLVARKGTKVKQGETATMEINLTQIRSDDVDKITLGKSIAGTGCKVVTSSETILDSHYYDDFAFVGLTASGKPVFVIFKNALCTSGIELEAKKSAQAAPTVTFECLADLASGENTLPYKIVWPDASTAVQSGGAK